MADPKPTSPPNKSVDDFATMSQANASIDTSRSQARPPSVSRDSSVPKSFGRYKIEKELGKGGMGVVYLAEDTQLGRKVALKIPKASVFEDSDAMERFYREARTTATLRHNNICPVFDVGAIDGVHYLTMAYIPGKPVSSYLGKSKLPAPKQVALLIRKIALALAEAHRLGIIHRDLKPSNVMLDERNEPIVMDFGLAFQVNTEKNARLTQSGAVLGTPAYMAPEQVSGDLGQIGVRSDIYALGVMLYQFLTGELPFNGPVLAVFAQILRDQPRRPSEVRPEVPAALEAICLKMMAKNGDERYATMQEVASALTEYIKTGTISGIEATVDLPAASADTPEIDFENPQEFPDFEPRSLRQKTIKKTTKPPPASTWMRLRQSPWFWSTAAGLTALPLLALLAVVLVLRNDTVEVEIKIDDPTAVVKVDGKQVDITSGGIGKVRLTLKEHTYSIERNDEVIEGPQRFSITKNGSRLLDLARGARDESRIVVDELVPDLDAIAKRKELLRKLLALGAQIDLAAFGNQGTVTVTAEANIPENAAQRRIRQLVFRGPPVPPASLGILKELPYLESVRFETDRQSTEIWPLLRDCPRLNSLHVRSLTDEIIEALPELPQLTALSGDDCSAVTRTGLEQLSRFSRLEFLGLTNATLSNFDLEQFPSLPELRRLAHELKAPSQRVGARLVSSCPKLIKLELNIDGLQQDELAWLEKLKLEELTVSISPKTRLSLLPRFDQLGYLKLNNFYFGAQAFALTSSDAEWIANFPTLTKLELYGATSPLLTSLPPMPRIKSLWLSCFAPGSLDSAALAVLPQFRELQDLVIYNAQFTESDVDSLVELTKLTWLWLNYCAISQSGLDRLRQALPNCRVEHHAPLANSPAPATEPATPRRGDADNYALNFTEKSARVELPILDDWAGPWTLEAWVRPAEKLNLMSTILATFRAPRGIGMSLFQEQLEAAISMADQPTWATAKTGRRLETTRFHHVAAVYEQRQLTVFLNGKQVGQVRTGEEHAPTGAKFCIGGYNDGDSFAGLIDEVRISKCARYREAFDPSRRWTTDDETLGLYHCDEGQGDVLKDSSGHDRDGKILGTKWELAELSQSQAPPPAVAPFDTKQARAHQEAWAKHLGVPVEWENSIGMKFVLIPPGEFTMGSTPKEIEPCLEFLLPTLKDYREVVQSEMPPHKVVLSQPFYLGVHEVTQRHYEAVMNENPSFFHKSGRMAQYSEMVGDLDTSDFPVDGISWNDAARFCIKLSENEQRRPLYFASGDAVTVLADGDGYRLPSEAQWEFSCRAGNAGSFWSGDAVESLLQTSWVGNNSAGRTHRVGELKSNPFGLFDTHGNASEWVQDGWEAGYYGEFVNQPAVDPQGPALAVTKRVQRGGVIAAMHMFCRSASRATREPFAGQVGAGFRISLPVRASGNAQAVPSPAPQPTAAAAQAQVEIINRLTAKGFQFTLEIDRKWQHVTQQVALPEQFDEFRVLTAATWQNNRATEEDFDELHVFPDLQEIGFNYFAVSADLLGRLAERHPKLPGLRLGELDMNLAQAASVAKFHELRNLSIDKCPKLTTKGLQSWASLTKLQSLTLRDSPLTDRDLEQFPSWPELTTLSLTGARVEGYGAKDLPTKCPKLTRLDLYGCSLVGSQLAWLGQLPLEELKLSLGTFHDMRLDHLPPLPKLKKLMFNVSGRYGQQNKVVPQFTEFRPTEIDWLTSCPELSELEVWSLGDRQVSQLSAVQNLQKLIVMYTDDLSPQTLETLQPLPNLEYLFLVFCNINDTHAPVLAKFDKLAGLMLAETKLTPDGMRLIRDGLPKCQISMSPTTTSTSPPGQPANTTSPKAKSKAGASKKSAKVEPDRRAAEYALSVGGTVRLVNDTREIKNIADLPRTPFLLDMALLRERPLVSDEGLAAFAGCKNLTHLDLVRTNVTDAGLAHFHGCKNLGILDLVGAPVGDDGLLGFKGSKNIRSLWLGGTKVTDRGLAAFKECNILFHLDLQGTKVSDDGLANFRGSEHIQYLYLRGTQMTDKGLANFRNCLKLLEVDISGTRVTDNSAVGFQSCKQLKVLRLKGTDISPEAIPRIQRALPACKIE